MDIVQQATNYKQLKKGANEGAPMHVLRRAARRAQGTGAAC